MWHIFSKHAKILNQQTWAAMLTMTLLVLFTVNKGLSQTHEIVIPNGGGISIPDTIDVDGNGITICPRTWYLVREISQANAQYDVWDAGNPAGAVGTIGGSPTLIIIDGGTLYYSDPNDPVCVTGDFLVYIGRAQGDLGIQPWSAGCGSTLGTTQTETFTNIVTTVPTIQRAGVAAAFSEDVCANPRNGADNAISFTGTNDGGCTGCTSVEYGWSFGPTSNNLIFPSSYSASIPTQSFNNTAMGADGTVTDVFLFSENVTGATAPAPAVCYDYDIVEMTTRHVPELPVSASAGISVGDGQICEGTPEDVTGTCTDHCPTTTGGAPEGYEWLFRQSGTTGGFETTPSVTHVFSGRQQGTTTTTNVYSVDPTGMGLAVGEYDVFLKVTNEYGCADSLSRNSVLTVNPVPGVQVLHNYGDPTWTTSISEDYNVSTNPLDFCTGRELQIRVKGCDDTDYTPADYPGTVTDPNNPPVANPGLYTSPCDGTDPNYFARTILRVFDAGGTQLELTDPGTGVYTAAPGTGNAVTFNPHASGSDTYRVRTLETGVLRYRVTAIGENGCRRVDEVTLNVRPPTLGYTASSNTALAYVSGDRIPGCEGTVLQVTPTCDLCYVGGGGAAFHTTWTNPTGGANGIGVNSDSSNVPVQSVTITTGADREYRLSIEGNYGCTNTGQTDNFDVFDFPLSTMTRVDYNGDLCTGTNLSLRARGHVALSSYEIYAGDPDAGGTPLCAGFCTESSYPGSDVILDAPTPPVNGTTYYVLVYRNSGGLTECPKKIAVTYPLVSGGAADNTPTPVVVRETPNLGPATTFSGRRCNGSFTSLYLDLNGTDPVANGWNITWSGRPGPGTLDADPLIDTVPFPARFMSPQADSARCFTIFIFTFCSSPRAYLNILPSPHHYTPINGGNNGVIFTATIDNGGCSQDVEFDAFDLFDCDIPVLYGRQLTSTGSTDFRYAIGPVENESDLESVCAGNGIRLEVFTQNTAGLTYLWSSGETTRSIDVMTTASSPDTMSRTVTVIGSGDTTVLTHTFFVSKGTVEFYPQGDNNLLTVDTVVCAGDPFFMYAQCPSCYGDVSYTWNQTTRDTISNPRAFASHPVTIPNGTTDTTLHLSVFHGPQGLCEDSYNRNVNVQGLPAPLLTYQQTAGAPLDTLDNTVTASLASRCVGQVARLTTNCTNCGTAPYTYQWNTGATSASLAINNSGGYYVEVTNGDGCRSETSVAVIVDASDGAITPAISNPTQICNGAPVALEVAPCVGCTYEWLQQQAPLPAAATPVGTQRIYPTTTAGTYFAQITNIQGCVYTTNTVAVTTDVITAPIVMATTDTICSSQTSTLSTGGGTGYAFQWYKRESVQGIPTFLPISGATDSAYTTNPGATGFYIVEVTYPNGCQSESLIFELYSGSFTPTASSIKTEICRGETVEVATALQAGWQYQWYQNGIAIPGETGSSYYADSAGSYYVLVTNDNLCQAQTSSVTLTKSDLTKPNVNTSTPTICPGELGRLSVSLCSGCSYQWFNTNPSAISTNSSSNFNFNNIQTTGNYFAVVAKGTCREVSDTVTITQNQVFTPAINAISDIVCDGVDGALVTQGCVGCSYTWLLNGVPALGSLNDTFIVINSVNDIGNYQVAVDYPNGCSDTSATLRVTNGSFTAYLTIDTAGGVPLDSVICNGNGENLRITDSVNLTGTYLYTLFLDNTPVTNQSNIAINSGTHIFPGDNAGVYTAQIVNPNGCRAVSNILPLRSVNLSPVIASRATLDPNSVPATALCTDSSSVVLWVNAGTCATCNYQWRIGGADILGATNTVHQTDTAGLYIVVVEEDGCEAASNAISINSTIGTVNTIANTADTSICNGNPVTLRYAGPTCAGCSYRWLEGQRVINGATTNQYVATQTGNYFLEITTADGCIDQSDTIRVQEVTPPVSFNLDLGSTATPATPLASNSSPINLNDWLTPVSIRQANLTLPDSGQFISTPFSANINCGGALPCYPGLSGTGNQTFTPADSLAGFFQITYLYTTNGCTFSTSDILEVLEPAAITISNANPASVPYEACIGDVLTIQTTNTDSAIGSLWAYDLNGMYVQMTPDTIINQDTVFGTNTFWNTTIIWTVPDSAYASNLLLRYTGGQDSVLTPFLLIHNTDLTLSGLPSTGELCSNGTGVTLFGNPSGGIFSVETPAGVPITGVTVADTLYPSLINPALYSNGGQLVDVVYSYTETYTNGNTCPNLDRVAVRMDVRDVRLTGVEYNTISASQVREELTNLVYRTYPYDARPNKQPLYTSTFSGSFTSPAGAPEFFLPANAGVGRHALTYRIQNGTCINSVEDSITVVPAPVSLGIPDTICRNFGTTAFRRSNQFPFNFVVPPSPNGIISFLDSVHILRVSGRGVSTVNTNLGSETFIYNPNAVTGNRDTLVMEYIFYRNEDTLATGQPFDTLEYTVASIVQPIFIEDPLTVQITDTIVSSFYCQENTLKLLAASPPDTFGRGLFMLFGGTNQYQNGDTLFNSVMNPFDINNLENATTTYDLVYILNGAACRNADTMQITIARGLNPAFTTVTGQTTFCDDDPAVGIVHNVTAPDTAIWKIGGIPQPSYTFSPAALNPALHVVELQQIYTYATPTDTFFCSESAIDTFEVYPLPAVSISPALDAHYCANDTVVDFVVSPSPDCPVFGANGHYLLDENFDTGIPASWGVTTNAGSPWAPDAILPQGGIGGAAITDTSTAVNDAWLVSAPMNLVAGHTYRLTYMVRAGAAVPSCSGFCDASLRVAIGTAAVPTAITAQLDYQPIISNDQTYVRYTVDHFHNPGAGFVTGTYYMGFHSFTPAFGRALRLDNVEFRDLTVDSCAQAGIGFVSGPGAYKVVDSLYRFDPLAVPAGNINVAYEYTDIRGCSNTTSYNITVDTAPVVSFTNMDSSYCENEPTVMLTGSPLGGNFNSTFGRGVNLINIPFSAPLDTAFYPVNYQTNVTGTDIVSYTYLDGNGCSETAYDTVVIVPLVDINVISSLLDPLGYGHCVEGAAVDLRVDAVSGSLFTNGVFYGPGVRNGAGGANAAPGTGAMFHPDSAALDLGYTGDANLMYVYTTSSLCSDTARFTTRVHAMPDPYFSNLPDSLCLNADTFQVVAINRVVTGPFGQTTFLDTIAANGGFYTVTDVNGALSSTFIQLFDTLSPGAAGNSPWMYVSYEYQAPNSRGGCITTIYDSVRIDSIPVVYFNGLRPYYCENEPPSIFLAFPSYYVGSGYLQIGNTILDSSFYWIDPAAMVGPGQTVATYPTYYTYTDSRGCSGEVFDTFQVRPFPRITLAPNYQDTFCRQVGLYDLRQSLTAPLGGYFTDNLALTSIVDSFYLNLNSTPGPRLVTYHYTDPLTLCSNKDSMWIYIFSSPELDFEAFGGCAQMDITFQGTASNLVPGIDSITRIWWDFEGNGNFTYTRLDTTPITIPDTMYQYATDGVYNVTLYVNNQGGCVESVTKPIIISPYYNLANGDYFEDFNAGAGNWHSDQPTTVVPDSIWTHAFSIAGNHININDGAWGVTNGNIYAQNLQAWVYSPCYDFTTSRRPMIAFDLWRDVLASIDGVVLEFYNVSTRQWELVGNIGDGIKWYQDFVLSRPGNQTVGSTNFPIGWTGRSGQLESARVRLDQFKGQRDIRFRIAFATAASTVIDTSWTGYEGAAFDNVFIGERTRNVLVEHFSNENYTDAASNTSRTIDQSVYNKIFNPNYGLDVILLQYQIDKDGHTGDPVYQTNSGDFNARSFTYSAGPNDIFIDGRVVGNGRSTDLNEWEMDFDMLQFPSFDIRIDQPITVVGSNLTASATIEALEALPDRDYTIRMVAMQDSLTFTSNTTPTVYHEMFNVVRKLIPDNSGFLEDHAWTIGQTATVRDNWDFPGQTGQAFFDPNQLEVVVFIQDNLTKEVYQAASTQDVNRFNGTQQLQDQDQRTEIFAVNVFPNPASELFNVAFKAPLSQAYNWRLVDITGRTLQQGMVQAGTEQFGISADRLTDGAYFFVINSEDNQVYAHRKLVVIKR